MTHFRINGPTRLSGEVRISGSKNAALPILFASLLTSDAVELTNVPDISDVNDAILMLQQMGCTVRRQNHILSLKSGLILSTTVPLEPANRIRGSILALGPLISRFGSARLPCPGGCVIGLRPIDLHVFSLKQLGVSIHFKDGYLIATTKGEPLRGTNVVMDKVSIGATLNVMMAATRASGKTHIVNAASEPEVRDTADFLNKMGANITFQSTRDGKCSLTITGSANRLSGTIAHQIIPDRIEAGTFLVAAAVSGGCVTCLAVRPDHMEIMLQKLQEAGSHVKQGKDWISVDMRDRKLKAVSVTTAPYPGFPTDLQPLLCLLNMVGKGEGSITETIFENRFMHVSELRRMGAKASIRGNTVSTWGVNRLTGSFVKATDLRASVSLVIAGCAARGVTVVENAHLIDRGYENIEKRFADLGASIVRCSIPM